MTDQTVESMEKQKQTPLTDLLESIPRDAVLVVEHDQFSSTFHPVGRLCHEAAAELRRLHAQAAQDEALLRQALEALEQIASDLPWELTALQADTIATLRERLGKNMEQKA